MISTKEIVERINQEIEKLDLNLQPAELYDPLSYTLGLGGKRIRPTLTILGLQLFQEEFDSAIKPSLAVELFHNSTLIHDDIIDNAPLRRGEPSVYAKWGQNVAVLSGDTMAFKAYELMSHLPAEKLAIALPLFNKTALDVMEGQQWDINFEEIDSVTEEDYLKMIGKKTSSLMGFSFQYGGVIGGAKPKT